ncbi:MAG: GET complex subunit get1 [Chrysothrix sp. TS-e1954]|nr:MAG: GET complex subunit get1 [Chrysothrix sp. TS-e1954]
MLSLLAGVFLLQLAIHLINNVGVAAINELAWMLYNKLPTHTAANTSKAKELRQRLVRLKKQVAGVSAQDDFAAWAKLRRQHDKVAAEQEKASGSMQSSKTQFETTIGVARWLGTTGLRFFLQFWCTKKPMFWLPAGLAPVYVEWIASFPRAPSGSVSIQVWFITCAALINMASDMVKMIIATRSQALPRGGTKSKQPAKGLKNS